MENPVATEEVNKDAPVLVDINSILQQSDESENQLQKEAEKATPQFVCSSCPRTFSSKMKRIMHEKLHMQNRGICSTMKSKLKELTSKDMAVVNASCASSNNTSLLCVQCNVYFRSSREMQDHGCKARKFCLINTRCNSCHKHFRSEDARIKRCLNCKRSQKMKSPKQQSRATEEIREINGQKVKVIVVNNLGQLDQLDSPSKDPLSEPTPNLLKKADGAEPTKQKQKRMRRNSPSKVSNKKPCPEKPAEERPIQPDSPVLSDQEERTKVKFQCVYCTLSFIFPNLLESHSRAEHGKFFYCYYCFLMFSSNAALDIHRIECLRKKIDPKVRDSLTFVFDIAKCTCLLCDLNLDDHQKLLIHAKSNHGHEFQSETDWILERSSSCCGIQFSSRSELVLHKKSKHCAVDELTQFVDLPCPKDNAQMENIANSLTKLKMISFKCSLCPIVNYSAVADSTHQRIVHGAAD